MIRAVLDTYVILAELLSRRGAAFEILQRLRNGEWRLVLSNHLLLEYEEVLKRNASALALTYEEIDLLLNAICLAADCFPLPPVQTPRLTDADDDPFCGLPRPPAHESLLRTICVISPRQPPMASGSCRRVNFSVSCAHRHDHAPHHHP